MVWYGYFLESPIVTDTLSIQENDIHFTSLYGEIWRDLSGPGSFRGNSSGKKGNKKGLFTQREWPKKVYSLKESGHRELDISDAGRNEFVKNFVTYMYNVLCK